MNDISEVFWNASVEEIKQGYVFEAATETFLCLVCGQRFLKGVIYPHGNVLYEAERFVKVHIQEAHQSMFEYLLGLDKKWTGLTDLQRSLLQFFNQGLSDREIGQTLDGRSTSTIRHHRFTLREKEKQAKIFLAIMELVGETPAQADQPEAFIPIHRTATMVDERYAITEKENEQILRKYFPEGTDGPLKEFPLKQKRKVVILRQLVQRFDPEATYTEREVNAILKEVFPDISTLRRYLIEYGFMDRVDDGSKYWVKK
jgi:hypothetical protein